MFDTIAAESQRLINEAFSTFVQMFLPRYGQPDTDALHDLSTAIRVDRQQLGDNPRSTLGTATDVCTLFRLLFARVGAPKVPHAVALAFTTRAACARSARAPRRVSKVGIDAPVDNDESLAEGASLSPTFNVGGYYRSIFANSGLFDLEKKLRDSTEAEGAGRGERGRQDSLRSCPCRAGATPRFAQRPAPGQARGVRAHPERLPG